jgi:hypothetical protein
VKEYLNKKEGGMELTDNEEQLVADLATDFAERFRDGDEVSMQDYLERLPTDAMKDAFREVANMSRFLSVMQEGKKEKVGAKIRQEGRSRAAKA